MQKPVPASLVIKSVKKMAPGQLCEDWLPGMQGMWKVTYATGYGNGSPSLTLLHHVLALSPAALARTGKAVLSLLSLESTQHGGRWSVNSIMARSHGGSLHHH